MHNSVMKDWLDLSFLTCENQSYIEFLYEDYLTDPNSVNVVWRDFFNKLPGASSTSEYTHSETSKYFRSWAKDFTRY
ncbi:MAG: hypothetical protein ACEY3J_03890 [Arsenophonus sp.]